MKPRILRNPDYAQWVPFPAGPGQCQAIFPDGSRCMAHRRLHGGEAIFCSVHAALPLLEADTDYPSPPSILPADSFELPFDLEEWWEDDPHRLTGR